MICSVVEALGLSVPLGQLPEPGCPLRVKCMLTGSAPHCHVTALAPVFVRVCVAAHVPALPPLVESCASWSAAGLNASAGGWPVGLGVGVLEPGPPPGPPGLPPVPTPEPPGVLPLDGVALAPEAGVPPDGMVLLPPDDAPLGDPVGLDVAPELVTPPPWLPPDVLVGATLPLVAVCPAG